MTTYYDHLDTPIGRILLAGNADALTHVGLPEARHAFAIPPDWQHDPHALAAASRQFEAYFAGAPDAFDLHLAPQGTPFQRQVWDALLTIPYGVTISYVELARRIGKPAASRAVGLANGANPLAIVIPCHRVIGANGSLTGYGGGLTAKRFLLELERRHVEREPLALT